MRNLTLRTRYEKAVYKRISNSKNGSRKRTLLGLVNDVVLCYGRFQRYITNLSMYRAHAGLSRSQVKALKHCYDVSTNALKAERTEIFSRLGQNYKCPYCGLGDGTDGLDHFLPQQHFPELSILTKNLVPCCNQCNNTKRTKFGQGGCNEFFYPYADTLPDAQFLFCNLDTTGGQLKKAVYYLSKPSSFPQNKFYVIENHFTNLKLLNEYEIGSAQIIRDMLGEYRNTKLVQTNFSSLNAARGKRNYLVASYGINNYAAVLLNEICNSGQNYLP